MAACTERFGEGGLTPPWSRYQHVERHRWAARFATGGSVLGAACRTGYGADILARAGATRVVGLDVSAEAVAVARTRVRAGTANFTTGDVCALPFPDRSFDLYASFDTVEHVADADRFAAEARRVLKPGGTFLCSTPNRVVTNPATGPCDKPFNPFHVREYTAEELTDLLRQRSTRSKSSASRSIRGGT